MTDFEYSTQGPLQKRFTVRAVFEAWRHITRAQIEAAFLFGSAVFLYHVVVWSWFTLERPSLIRPLIAAFMYDQLEAFALMLAVVVADHVTGGVAHRRTPYALAVVISTAVMTPLASLAATWFVGRLHTASVQDQLSDPGPYLWTALGGANYMFFEWLVLGGAATFIYLDRRRAQAAHARMHAAQLERARTAKRALESRLQAMQARVEPQFLFNTLGQVRDLYRANAAHGERMLDELIAYLRAAMPKMRDTSSTLAQEIELTRAYLAIVKVRLGDRLTYELESPPEAGEARMPPMMLLPLVDHAVARGFAESQSTGSIRIHMAIAGRKMKIEIVYSGMSFLPENEGADTTAIRDRLSALYGSDASLVLQGREPCATEAVLVIPHEIVAAFADRAR